MFKGIDKLNISRIFAGKIIFGSWTLLKISLTALFGSVHTFAEERRLGCFGPWFALFCYMAVKLFPKHMLHSCLYEHLVPVRPTRYILSLNDLAFRIPTNRTDHYFKCFIPFDSRLWNILPNHVVQCMDLKHFKAALKIYLDSLVPANIPPQHHSILSWLLWAVLSRICGEEPSSVLKQYCFSYYTLRLLS